jgi:hypothetical protein
MVKVKKTDAKRQTLGKTPRAAGKITEVMQNISRNRMGGSGKAQICQHQNRAKGLRLS